MASPHPLTGLELIDCARANAVQGLDVACELCGYGNDIPAFQQQLRQAFADIGLDYQDLSSLLTESGPAMAAPIPGEAPPSVSNPLQ
jgi:hypothetical protein